MQGRPDNVSSNLLRAPRPLPPFIKQLQFESPFISVIETIAAAWLSPCTVLISFFDDRICLTMNLAIKGSFGQV